MTRYCVIVALPEGGYATLTVRDRMAWTRRHAERLARDYKAENMCDAWTEEAQGYETHAAPRPNAFRPFPPVNGAYGAPMGRMSANLALDPEHDTPASLAVAGPAGEYDAGGAYWGQGGPDGPVWAVWRKGKAHEGVAYVRAKSREGAKRAALA